MKEISERIKLIRKCARNSENEFATKIGVSVDILLQWENNQSSPSLEELLKISQTYNISTEFILNGNANSSDNIFLYKKLAKEDLIEEIKEYLLNALKSKQSPKFIDKIVDIAILKEKISIQNIDLHNQIFFELKDILDIGDYNIYLDIQKSFEINGAITFDLLSPHKHSLDFYNEALKNDAEQIENTFLEYTSNKEVWNDEIILWLINHGAVCLELVSYDISATSGFCNDGYPVDIHVYSEPIYEENLILTFLLKSELERKLNK